MQGVSLPQKIQDLSSHHSIRAGSIGQRGNAPLDPFRRQRCLCQDGKGSGQQGVSGQDRIGLAKDLMVGGFTPTEIIVIHTGQVIMNQGICMHHLQPAGKGQCIFGCSAEELANFQHQNRPNPFSPRQ